MNFVLTFKSLVNFLIGYETAYSRNVIIEEIIQTW
jgi:hypothetical protein